MIFFIIIQFPLWFFIIIELIMFFNEAMDSAPKWLLIDFSLTALIFFIYFLDAWDEIPPYFWVFMVFWIFIHYFIIKQFFEIRKIH